MAKVSASRSAPLYTAADCGLALKIARPTVHAWFKRLRVTGAPGRTKLGALAVLFSQEQYEELRAAVSGAGPRSTSARRVAMGKKPGRATSRTAT